MGIDIVPSIDELLRRVDVVLLQSIDGHPHLEQALPVLRARKPLFVDKPVAGSLADAVLLYDVAKHFKTPVFSSSSLRYTDGAKAIVRRGRLATSQRVTLSVLVRPSQRIRISSGTGFTAWRHYSR